MTQVSFYLFEKSQERQAQIACRLCRKLWQKNQMWLFVPEVEQQHALDELLWNFDASSFLAHGIHQPDAPICISGQLPTDAHWMVINLSDAALQQVERFAHVIEIVEQTEAMKQQGREKFKQYRRDGIEPRTFKL